MAGGYGEGTDFSVQVYNVNDDAWRTVTPLYTPRR